MRSSMFLADVTVIDLAYISHTGSIVGSSVSPKFIVSGEVTGDESVVVDFSKIKKKIKALIDDNDSGYDHKLWLFSNSNVKPYDVSLLNTNKGMARIKTSHLDLTLPVDSLRVIDSPCSNMLEAGVLDSTVEVDIESYLTSSLSKEYPGIQVQCKLSFDGASMDTGTQGAEWFRYVHGLKDSSSWGCQNNSHGHLSYMQLLNSSIDWAHVDHPLLRRIASQFNGSVFINKENVIANNESEVRIEYTSRDRGVFIASYDKRKIKTCVIPTETTIEYLVEHIKKEWWDELKNCGATHLAVSEGLTKGAVTELT